MTTAPSALAPDAVTLGVLAGGRASRLGGRDKAWLTRDGRPQVLRLVDVLRHEAASVLVSANRDPARYAARGLPAIADRRPGLGPLGGLDALAHACTTPWLATVPVDLVDVPVDLIARLATAAGPAGACARDDDGLQPLVALWRVEPLRRAAAEAIEHDARTMHDIVARMGLAEAAFAGLRFGNLNTPADLVAAGVREPDADLP